MCKADPPGIIRSNLFFHSESQCRNLIPSGSCATSVCVNA